MTIKKGWGPAICALGVCLLYAKVFHADFIWDDAGHVASKALLSFPSGLKTIWLIPGATQQYYPLTHTVFWMAYGLWGMNPIGYHVLTVLLHAATAILLWVFLSKLHLRHAGWITAAWALHPLQVESVAWISELKNTLSAFFYFIALIAFFQSLKKDALSRRWYWVSMAAFVAALASKTITCSWPVIVLLIGFWQRRRMLPLLKKLAPFFAIALAAGLVTIWVEKTHMGASGNAWTLTPSQHIVLAGRIFWFYIDKLAWPIPQAFIYPRWTINPRSFWQILYPLSALGLYIGLGLNVRRVRGVWIAMGMYAATLFPALGFFNLYPMRYSYVADHFQYLAGIPILWVFVEGLSQIASTWRFQPSVRWGLSSGCLLLLAGISWSRIAVFQNAESIWRDVLRSNPRSTMAHNNLGMDYKRQHRLAEAEHEFQAAAASDPTELEAFANLGLLYSNQGRYTESAAAYRQAIIHHPADVSLRSYAGIALMQAGRYAEAATQLDVAVRLGREEVAQSPSWKQESMLQMLSQVEGNLGVAYYQAKRWLDSEKILLEALEHNPRDPVIRYHLARTLVKRHKLPRAHAELEAALALDPAYTAARNELKRLR